MKNRIYSRLLIAIIFVLTICSFTHGQLCDEAGKAQALNTQMQWVLDYDEVKNKNWVTTLKPILTEMQRVFPQPPKGLYLRNTIVTMMDYAAASPNDVHRYKGYFAIRNLVCRRSGGMNKFIPAEDPESFVHFYINEMFPGGLSDEFQNLKTGDLRIAENANGIKGVYEFNENNEQKFIGWYFSENKGFPFRRLSKAELAQKFREYSLKKWDARIRELETALAKTDKDIAEISANQYMSAKDRQAVIEAIRKADVQRKKDLETAKSNREICLRKADSMLKAPDANSDARVTMLNGEPEGLEAPAGKGKYIYVENQDFFDKKLPKWQPQFILAWHDRYDNSAAQIAFNNKFENEFDFNALRKLVGMQPMAKAPTITGMGGTVGSSPNKTTENNTSETNGVMFSEDFANASLEQKPPKWTVSNDTATVKNSDDYPGKWLAIKKGGLFYPDFSLLLLPPKFTLEFDVSWNKKISYYSPNFVINIGAARYDNTLKSYDKAQVNPNSYTSSEMNRIEIWLDPHWNSSGRYGLQIFDARGGYIKDISDKTSAFFRDNNRVHVKIVREGARIQVYFNNEKAKEDPKINLDENIRWNFFGFGLSNASNADVNDEFYLSNIRLIKQ